MRRGTLRTAVVALVRTVTVGCTASADRTAEVADGSSIERDYRPTQAWRTADPASHGFDDDELSVIEQYVSDAYTNVRSILVVRDGWQWWIGPDDEQPSFFARGLGGQVVYVHPGLDLVAVVTSDPEDPHRNADDLVELAILPAAED